MSVIKPFKGIRPKTEIAAKVASPPYDVLNSNEAREMAKKIPIHSCTLTSRKLTCLLKPTYTARKYIKKAPKI